MRKSKRQYKTYSYLMEDMQEILRKIISSIINQKSTKIQPHNLHFIF